MSGAKYFSNIDLTDAFQQLKLSERSKALLTVNAIIGLLACERLPLGIKTAPQIFQRVMDEMLKGIDGVMCYIDDIMICSKTEAEHYEILRQVFQSLQEHNDHARINKCCFLQSSIDYLGHTIDREGVHPTQSKVEALLHAPVPTNVAELQSFLGFVSPLNALLGKDVPWKWTKQCESAYKACKNRIPEDSCLTHYDVGKQIRLAYDASYCIGAVISHVMDDGSERPIAMDSHTLT